MKSVLLTGATSFTGFWIARKLHEAGVQVVCTLTEPSLHSYHSPEKKRRIELLTPIVTWLPEVRFGEESFLKALESTDLLCHHGAEVTDYRSPTFDYISATQKNTFGAEKVVQTLAASDTPLFVTGTIFESYESPFSRETAAVSPYGLSKSFTYEIFLYLCTLYKVPLGKFIIANPFGAHENKRFTHYLMTQWSQGMPIEVKAPHYFRDNIPGDLLGTYYAAFALHLLETKTVSPQHYAPGFYQETTGDFTRRTAEEVRKRTGWECNFQLCEPADFSEPMVKTNEKYPLPPSWDEKNFWDEFVLFYREHILS